jgi:hypothetical protein
MARNESVQVRHLQRTLYRKAKQSKEVKSNSGDVEVYVSREGNPAGVPGEAGGTISDPKSIIEGHEVLGHGRLMLLGLPSGQQEAIDVENEIRRGRGLPERANP